MHNAITKSYSSGVSNYDPFDQAAQESKRKQRELKEQLASKSEQDDVAWLMSSKRGRRILWRFLDRAGVYRTSFNQNSMTMAFNEGVRNEGLRLVATIHACAPEQYPVMLKEANDN